MDWLDWITALLAAAVAVIALYQTLRQPSPLPRKTEDNGDDAQP